MMEHHRSLRGQPTSTSTPAILTSLLGSIAVVVLVLIGFLVYCWRKRQCKDLGMLRRQRTAESATPDDEASVTSENSQSLGVDVIDDQDAQEHNPNRWPRRWTRRRPPKRLLLTSALTSMESQKPSKRRKRQSPSGKSTENLEMERSNDTSAAASLFPSTQSSLKDYGAPRERSTKAQNTINNSDDAIDIVRSTNWEKSRKAIALVIHAQQHPESYA